MNKLLPSAALFQETKSKKIGRLKFPGYQVFEKIRKDKCGGGLMSVVDNNLNPVLIETNEDVEMLVVDSSLPVGSIVLINAYGPQESDTILTKVKFWGSLQKEVERAKEEGKMVLIQMDANAKIGNKFLKRNPKNETSSNGKFLIDLVRSNKLVICNNSDECRGIITRQRYAKEKKEGSILDYIIVCDEPSEHLINM